MKEVMVVIGTRPEAIKLAPVVSTLKARGFDVSIVATAQHRDLLDQTLAVFGLRPDYDLDIMKPGQTLNDVAEAVINRLPPIFAEWKPDCVLVQGDTTTAFAAALAAFYAGIRVGHVEAGLRTYDRTSPFPEEINRQLIGRLADIHFAPTEGAKSNLLNEQVPAGAIHVVGNTEIDAILHIVGEFEDATKRGEVLKKLAADYGIGLQTDKKIVLVTAHRRESFNGGIRNICEAVKETARKRSDVVFIYPVHPNPNVQKTAHEILDGVPGVSLSQAMDYESFAFLMSRSYVILTDSGGVQEAAPSLGKPVLVMREKTERMEGVRAGVSKLVGTDKEKIISALSELLDDPEAYTAMTGKQNPYGDGKASARIAEALADYLK
ncbi:UDP-N-acetylglucosamine 2-epimerase (non-hydrolyzing) [Patescibacteria group bacterium]|nr:UDP-N-acetylglucosamine 2-epimerase (non-hydrolyzing) [Patescibacteria group bacterium]